MKASISKSDQKPKNSNRKCRQFANNIKQYQNERVIQKHLVYVIGLSSTIANKEVIHLINIDSNQGILLRTIRENNKSRRK